MTNRILENLFGGPATRDYPRKARPPFAATRGPLAIDIARCNFCGVCAAKCPSGCIRVDRQLACWTFDPGQCVACGVCVEACPRECLHQESAAGKPMVDKAMIILTGTKKPDGSG